MRLFFGCPRWCLPSGDTVGWHIAKTPTVPTAPDDMENKFLKVLCKREKLLASDLQEEKFRTQCFCKGTN